MKVCFVGSGSIGQRHIRNLYQIFLPEKIEIDLLRGTDRTLPEDISTIVSSVFYKIEDIQGIYDAIFITNPTYLHYQTIIALKDKSRYFFCGKTSV